AGRGDSIAQFRVTEFTRERKSEPDAGGRQRMPNRNRAAIHIAFVAVDPQLALHSDELRGKRFVDLESIDLTSGEPGVTDQLSNRRRRPHAHDLRSQAYRGYTRDTRERLDSLRFCISA